MLGAQSKNPLLPFPLPFPNPQILNRRLNSAPGAAPRGADARQFNYLFLLLMMASLTFFGASA